MKCPLPRPRFRRWQTSVLVAAGIAFLSGTGCGSSVGSSSSSSSGGTTSSTPVNNTQPIQVGAGPSGNDVNALFTSINICMPGTSTCQTISNVLVDTGSSGVRLLASQVTLPLPQLNDASNNPIGNCIAFADNSYAWGPVQTADIGIAGETASSASVQLIGATGFPAVPSGCNTGGANSDTVQALGANGILGIGVLRQDCGNACAASGSQLPPVYFSCAGGSCSAVAVSLQQQLQNPVAVFPQDNNGLLITLPALAAVGAPSVSGSLIFGIGTQSDNGLSGVQVYSTDSKGNYTVTFNGQPYSGSFVDSGSNGIFFLDAATLGIPTCSVSSSFYCPPSTMSYSTITTGSNGNSGTVAFSIDNAEALFANGANAAFNNLGGPNPGAFDFGLPFFFGRTVYLAIEGQSTSGGSGPYWAY